MTVINGTSNNDYLFGNYGNDETFAYAGNDYVTGYYGDDTLHGGLDNDFLYGNEGNDTLYGDEGNDYLMGGTGSDTLIGGDGNDILYSSDDNYYGFQEPSANNLQGGQGNDNYILANSADVVIEDVNAGIDTVSTSFNYTLTANVENLQLMVNIYDPTLSAKIGKGNELNNKISGNSQNNSLYGYDGADTLIGGNGDDALYGGTGDDLLYGGSSDFDYDSAGNDTLVGGDGNDTLMGGNGIDKLVGGNGDDMYFIDSNTDLIVETAAAGSGVDNVVINYNSYSNQAAFSYTLGQNLENLSFVNSGYYIYPPIITLTGNGQNNHIVGSSLNEAINGAAGNDSLEGGDGNDTLNGGTGVDTMVGGSGNDTFYVDNVGDVVREINTGFGFYDKTDTVMASVSYTLGDDIENLTLLGTANLNGTGNSLNNVIVGNVGNNNLSGGLGYDTVSGGAGNDTLSGGAGSDQLNGDEGADILFGGDGFDSLDGGLGADTLKGGLDNDWYVVDNLGDKVIELANQGTDTVSSSINYSLGANLENLFLSGSVAVTATGNELSNRLFGNALNNQLLGNAGDDWLDGGVGQDTMVGGIGNDAYFVDDVADVVVELANQGTDSVTSIVNYTLGANTENLTLLDAIAAQMAKGNNLANVILGNSLNNTLYGYEGNDQLNGAFGADTMVGGQGNDIYFVDSAADVVIELAGEGVDTVNSTTSYTLSDNIENLDFTFVVINYYDQQGVIGQGNALDNKIYGSISADVLMGLAGNDTFYADNDYNYYYYSINGVRISAGDTLQGGEGDDSYYADIFDQIIEAANEGTDTVYTQNNLILAANVENLVLLTDAQNGSGNELNNYLTGNMHDNQLNGGLGNDVLDGGYGLDQLFGGGGDDQLVGGYGDDVLHGDDGTDLLDGGYGDDQLFGDLGDDQLNGSYGADVLSGGAGKDALNGGSGDDILMGGADADTLMGGIGSDMLYGGTGDDTYVIDSMDDQIIELSGEGVDSIKTSIAYDLNGTFIENLWLTGSANINASGNSQNNRLTGNDGNNILNGKEGNDLLTGGAGNDTYLFGRGYATDTVFDSDATLNNTDSVQFGDNVAANQLWFSHVGNNLEVSIIGTASKLVVSDWYLGAAHHVEQFQMSTGRTLLDSKVENLVTAMASLTAPAIGQINLTASQHAALDGVIAANWS